MAMDLVALDQFIKPEVEHARDDLEQSPCAPVPAGPKVYCDRLRSFPGRLAILVELLTQRGREAFFGRAASQP
jgi:hypothetical protein